MVPAWVNSALMSSMTENEEKQSVSQATDERTEDFFTPSVECLVDLRGLLIEGALVFTFARSARTLVLFFRLSVDKT